MFDPFNGRMIAGVHRHWRGRYRVTFKAHYCCRPRDRFFKNLWDAVDLAWSKVGDDRLVYVERNGRWVPLDLIKLDGESE